MILSNHSYFFEELGLTSFTTLQKVTNIELVSIHFHHFIDHPYASLNGDEHGNILL